MSGMTGRPVRKPTRIPGYDYATAGMYFMTMCVQHRESRFGTFEHSAVCLNAAGEMVARVWQENIERYPGAALDLFVVMPDHMHAIVFAGTDPSTSGERVSLLRIVQSFKSLTTVEYAREVTKGIFPSYDRILRNQRELDGARIHRRESRARAGAAGPHRGCSNFPIVGEDLVSSRGFRMRTREGQCGRCLA